jgi:holo-[acyl-carrier protein] synthase
MIVGLGLDVVELERIRGAWERFGHRFAARVLTPAELEALPRHPVSFLAARFAAKEAASKALGTGIARGVGWHDMEVRRQDSGKPELLLHGAARRTAHALGATRAHVSLTHGRDVAAAVVVLET